MSDIRNGGLASKWFLHIKIYLPHYDKLLVYFSKHINFYLCLLPSRLNIFLALILNSCALTGEYLV